MELPQELRSKINELDELAESIREELQDIIMMDSRSNPERDTFIEALQTMQDEVTNIQEAEGWIGN